MFRKKCYLCTRIAIKLKTMKQRMMITAAGRLVASIALCCATTVMAEPISPNAARQAAAKFLNAKGAKLESEAMKAPGRAMGDTCAYYVFNASASKGFVVISGDDCVGENLVLGYTSNGSFDAEEIPDNLQWWLDETANAITQLSLHNGKPKAVALHDDIAPMVTAVWDQGDKIYNPQSPFNAFCPKVDGMLSLSGCMATALSQVMYYYRWPQGVMGGDLPTYTMADGTVIEGLPATSFDWDNMVDDYFFSTTEAQQTAVAKLMRYCGQMLQLDYNPQVTNGVSYDTDLLVNVFGYDAGVHSERANEYTVSGWNELIYNELREGRPIVYMGRSTGGGHAFVIDGYKVYEGAGYYDVNWGWGGLANGFYRINLLNPNFSGAGGSSTKDGYSYNQTAIIGLKPAQSTPATYNRYLSSLFSDISFEDLPHVFEAINPSYRPGRFTVALAERNADGTPDVSRIYDSREVDVEGYNTASFLMSHAKLAYIFLPEEESYEGVPAGRHNLVYVNRESGSDAPWKPIFGPASYIEVNIGDGGSVDEVLVHPLAKLYTNNRYIKIEGVKQYGLAQDVKLTIENKGDEDYIGGLEYSLYYEDMNKLQYLVAFSRSGLMVEAGSTIDIHTTVSARVTGTCVLLITKDGAAEDFSGTMYTDIKQLPGYLGHKSFALEDLTFYCSDPIYSEQTNEHGHTVCSIDFEVNNATTLDYNAGIVAHLYIHGEEGYYYEYLFPDTPYLATRLQVGSNSTEPVSLILPEPLDPGDYGIYCYMANDFYSNLLTDYLPFAFKPFTISETTDIKGVDDLTADGQNPDAWYDLNGRRISVPSGSSALPKGIYINKGRKVIVK